MQPNHTDILVIGGGVIGAAIAYECARHGRSVTLLEKNIAGAEASQAAAGMLGAQVESHRPGAFYDLCKAGRDLYRDWAKTLEELSGCTVDYMDAGILRVALTEDDEDELKSRLPWLGANVRWLSSVEVLDLEPAVGKQCRGGLYFSNDHQVNAPKLVQALRIALTKLNVDVYEHFEFQRWIFSDTSVIRGVAVDDFEITADQVVVAAGAWSAQILEPLNIRLNIRPVKGQCYAVRPKRTLSNRTVFTKGCYVVPKADGSLVIGATEEDSGFDKQINPDAVDRIQATAIQLIPELAEATFERTWTGLRPGTADGLPYIGKSNQWQNLFVAAGHFRNGILLTPITATVISRMINGEKPGVELAEFAVDRHFPLNPSRHSVNPSLAE